MNCWRVACAGRPAWITEETLLDALQRNFGPIMQIAWVIDDLDAAIEHWTRVMHVGPFFLFEHIPFKELWFRGQPARIDLTCAIAYRGEVQIELIRQHDDAPSIYSEFARGGRTGVQHLGVMTPSVAADLERLAAQGVHAVQHGRTTADAAFAYLDTDFLPGTMIELIEESPVMTRAFKAIREAAERWDGKERTRRFG